MHHDLASTQTEAANPVPVNHEPVHVNPVRPRKPASTSLHAREIITLNSMPVKKHQCERNPIRACSEVCTFSDKLGSNTFLCLGFAFGKIEVAFKPVTKTKEIYSSG